MVLDLNICVPIDFQQAVREDEEIQKRNAEMVALIQGNAALKNEQAKERRQQLLERIKAKSNPSKEQFYQKAEMKLKELQAKKLNPTPKPTSPECVMSVHVSPPPPPLFHLPTCGCCLCSLLYEFLL
jgi:hypothetical protein